MGLKEFIKKKKLNVNDKTMKHMESFIAIVTADHGEINWEGVIGKNGDVTDKFIALSLRLIANTGYKLPDNAKEIIIEGCKNTFKFNLFLCTMDKINKAFDGIYEASEDRYMEFLDIYRAALGEEINIKDMGLYLVGRKSFDKESSSVYAGTEIRKVFNDNLLNRLNNTLKKEKKKRFVKSDINDIILDFHIRGIRNTIGNNQGLLNIKEKEPETYEKIINSLIVSDKVKPDEYDKYISILNGIRFPNMEKMLKLYLGNLGEAKNKLTEHIDKVATEYFLKYPSFIRSHFELKFFVVSGTFDSNSEEGLKKVSESIAEATASNPEASAVFTSYNYILYVLRDTYGVFCYADYTDNPFAIEKILDTGIKFSGTIEVFKKYINFLKASVYKDDKAFAESEERKVILSYYCRDIYRYFSYNPEISGIFKMVKGMDNDVYKEMLDEIEYDANIVTNIDLFDYVKEDVERIDKEVSEYFFAHKIEGETEVEPQNPPEYNMLNGELAALKSTADNCENILADTAGYRTKEEKDEKRELLNKTNADIKELLKRMDEMKLSFRGPYDAQLLRQVAVFNNYRDEEIKNLYMIIKNPVQLKEEIIAKQKAEEEAAKKKKKKKKR